MELFTKTLQGQNSYRGYPKYLQSLVKMYKDEWIHEYKYWDEKNWQ